MLLDPLMKVCRSGSPEISDSITAGSACMSSAKFLPERVSSKWLSFRRSIPTLAIASPYVASVPKRKRDGRLEL